MKKYLFFALAIFISFMACNVSSDNYNEKLLNKSDVNFYKSDNILSANIMDLGNIEVGHDLNIPKCLDETTVDTFLYFVNEFNNYILAKENSENPMDSAQVIEMLALQEVGTVEDFYNFISTTFNIPKHIIKGFSEYSRKLSIEISRENSESHPIASRYYDLIKNGCLKSNLSDEMFENDVFIINMFRQKCPTFGDVLWSLFDAGLSTTEAIGNPNPVTVGNAVRAIVHYAKTISAC